jgi:hypothetical protein
MPDLEAYLQSLKKKSKDTNQQQKNVKLVDTASGISDIESENDDESSNDSTPSPAAPIDVVNEFILSTAKLQEK